MTGGLRLAEEAGIQDRAKRHLAEDRLDDLRPRIERRDDPANLGKVGARHVACLVDDDDIGKFNLLDEQFHELAVIMLTLSSTARDRTV